MFISALSAFILRSATPFTVILFSSLFALFIAFEINAEDIINPKDNIVGIIINCIFFNFYSFTELYKLL